MERTTLTDPLHPHPFNGWALDVALALDQAYPGFLAHSFRGSNLARQARFAALVALPLAAHTQTKQVPPKPAVETNLSTAPDDPSAETKALEAQQEARQEAWEEKARRLSRSIYTGC